ncbi:MAG: YciI family protein [Actinobacteria bacterium]|nr:YciI family protein [Actinomycetota bacterium]
MKYMFLLYGTGEPLPEPGTEAFTRMRADWDAATGAMARAGVLLDCAPLQPPAVATTVRVRDGEVLLTDGPAAEIKEHFGGYTLAECADLDEALKWAATLPTAHVGKVEVRPVVQVVAPAEQPAG